MPDCCTGHKKHDSRTTLRGGSLSDPHFLLMSSPSSATDTPFSDVVRDARSRVATLFRQASNGLKGSQTSDVCAHPRTEVGTCNVGPTTQGAIHGKTESSDQSSS